MFYQRGVVQMNKEGVDGFPKNESKDFWFFGVEELIGLWVLAIEYKSEALPKKLLISLNFLMVKTNLLGIKER